MPSSKVYLTYKRKLPSIKTGITHENKCHGAHSGGPSDTPVVASDNHDAQSDKCVSEDRQKIASISPGFITSDIAGNLLECKDRSIEPKHILNSEIVDYGFKRGETSDVMKLMTVSSCKLPASGTPADDPSEIHDLHLSFKKKSPQTESSPCSASIIVSQGKLNSQSTGINPINTTDFISSKSSCISTYDAGSHFEKLSNAEGTDSLSNDISMDFRGDCLAHTKLTGPLITFSRRCKKIKGNNGADVKSSNIEVKNCSSFSRSSVTADGAEALNVCLGENSTNTELPGEDIDSRPIFHINQDNSKAADSAQEHVRSSLGTKILIRDEELSHGSETTSKNGSPLNGHRKTSKVEMDAEEACLHIGLGISLNDVAEDPEAIVIDRDMEDPKYPDESEIMSSCVGKATVAADCSEEASRRCFDLSATPDSCGILDCNINLDLQKEPVHASSGSLRDSVDSTSRSYATALDLESPPELLYNVNKRVGETLPAHSIGGLHDALISAEEAGSNSKNDGEACPASITANASEKKCLQLFPEALRSSFHLATMKREVASMVLEESESLNKGNGSNQIRQTSCGSLLDLSLSLPTESNPCNYSRKFPLHIPTWKFDSNVRDSQSVSNQSVLFLRHKLMLDSIVSRASALNTKVGFRDKFKSHSTLWLDEELDSLWIGVRRHGRHNWHSILRDPRLHFSPWRTARDLAEQWEEEQAKLLNGPCSQFKYPLMHDSPLDHNSGGFLHPKVGIRRNSAIEESRLSLEQVYSRRTGSLSKKRRLKFAGVDNDINQLFRPASYPRTAPYSELQNQMYGTWSYELGCRTQPSCDPSLINTPFTSLASSGNLPHWLREVVNTSPRPVGATIHPSFTSFPHSGTMRIAKPYPDPSGQHYSVPEFGGASNLQPSCSAHRSNAAAGMRHGIAEASRVSLDPVNKPNNLIIIDSDASSEETISDDHCVRS